MRWRERSAPVSVLAEPREQGSGSRRCRLQSRERNQEVEIYWCSITWRSQRRLRRAEAPHAATLARSQRRGQTHPMAHAKESVAEGPKRPEITESGRSDGCVDAPPPEGRTRPPRAGLLYPGAVK